MVVWNCGTALCTSEGGRQYLQKYLKRLDGAARFSKNINAQFDFYHGTAKVNRFVVVLFF